MKNLDNKVLIRPAGSLQTLSKHEVSQLCDQTDQGLNELLKQCALAVLSTGAKEDSSHALMSNHPNFAIKVNAKGRGLQFEIENAPNNAFVNNEIIMGLQEHLSAVIRDLLYAKNKTLDSTEFNLNKSFDITNAIFHFARNAQLIKAGDPPNIAICWGGHSISPVEYKYSKHVGYHLGLRKLDICTGCGPGAMLGPMKGAVLGHGKQRHSNPRYIGLTEPGIISAEAPNAIVNELTIFPDIEKRLEAFVRLGHGVIVFPGGAGTLEEILYLMIILLHPKNKGIPFPVALTAPKEYEDYFNSVLRFIHEALGSEATSKFKVFIDQAEEVSEYIKNSFEEVREYRKSSSEAYYYNWSLHIPYEAQQPFKPTHNNMKQLNLNKNQPLHLLASQLRKAFSAIVAGNVKAEYIQQVAKKGPFEICGDLGIMKEMDKLLGDIVTQKRMKLGDVKYTPCYKIITKPK